MSVRFYLPTVHFGWEQISQNPPAAVELVEIVPHNAVIQLRKSDQSEVGFNSHKEQGTWPREATNERVPTGPLCCLSSLLSSPTKWQQIMHIASLFSVGFCRYRFDMSVSGGCIMCCVENVQPHWHTEASSRGGGQRASLNSPHYSSQGYISKKKEIRLTVSSLGDEPGRHKLLPRGAGWWAEYYLGEWVCWCLFSVCLGITVLLKPCIYCHCFVWKGCPFTQITILFMCKQTPFT